MNDIFSLDQTNAIAEESAPPADIVILIFYVSYWKLEFALYIAKQHTSLVSSMSPPKI